MDSNHTISMLCEENLLLKQQIAKLTEANEFNLKYRDLVNSLGEIVLVAQDNRIVYGNRKLEENLRLSLEEISSVPFSSFIHPDDRKIGETFLEAQDRHGKSVLSIFFLLETLILLLSLLFRGFRQTPENNKGDQPTF